MSLREDLLAEIDAFCAEKAMKPTTFGLLATNDGKFVYRLRQGSDVTGKTVDRVRAFIAARRLEAVARDKMGESSADSVVTDLDSRASAARSVA